MRNRFLSFDDPAFDVDWPLLESLLDFGADECTFTILLDGSDAQRPARANAFEARLRFASLGEAVRECTVRTDDKWRAVPLWRFDRPLITALRRLLPAGMFFTSWSDPVIVEDFTVYRRGEMSFGTITHERTACVFMTDDEWRSWKARVTGSKEM